MGHKTSVDTALHYWVQRLQVVNGITRQTNGVVLNSYVGGCGRVVYLVEENMKTISRKKYFVKVFLRPPNRSCVVFFEGASVEEVAVIKY